MQEDQERDPGNQHKKWHQKMTVSHDRLHAAKKIHLKNPFHFIAALSRVSGYVEATLYAIDCPVNNFKVEGASIRRFESRRLLPPGIERMHLAVQHRIAVPKMREIANEL
jgi:hypothetical protein